MSNIIAERILTLRRNANERQEDLAKALNCNRGTIANYEKGARTPDAETLAQIAKHYNTTTDYIVGLSDVTTSNITVKEICDYTGLNEKSINQLYLLKKASNGEFDLENVPEEYLEYSLDKSINEQLSVESYTIKTKNAITYLNQLIQSKHLLHISQYAYEWYCFDDELRNKDEYIYIKSCVKLLNELEFEVPEIQIDIDEVINKVAKVCSVDTTKTVDELINIISGYMCSECENNKGGADNGKHN